MAELEFQKFFKLAKVDETTHTVYGLATSEAVDSDGEIADYEGSKESFTQWSNDFLQRTTAAGQDISLGNIRVQHKIEVGGKVTRLDFKDSIKEVWLETSPANEDVWNMLKGGYLTGYSIGGKVTKTEKEGKYTRYWPKISEVSYVDNPANPEALFAYVKADGSIELRKFQSKLTLEQIAANARDKANSFSTALTENDLWEGRPPVSTVRNPLFSPEQLAEIQHVVFKSTGKTKRVAGEDLPSSAFAYVGDKNDLSTWKLPIHFSSEEKSARHVRNALARFNQTQGIPEDEKEKVHSRITAAAKKYGIDVEGESKKALAAQELIKTILSKGSDGELKKSLYDVGTLAQTIGTLASLYQMCLWEAEWENDDRDDALAVELSAAVQHLTEILKEMVDEETSELAANWSSAHKAATSEIHKGEESTMDNDEVINIAQELADLAKAGHTMKAHFHKMSGMHDKMAAHHEKMAAHHENMMECHKDMMEAHKAETKDPMHGFHKTSMTEHSGMHKMHTKMMECHKAMGEHCKAMGENFKDPNVSGGEHSGDEKAAKAAADKVAADALAKAAADKAAADALKPTTPVDPMAVLTGLVTDLAKSVTDLKETITKSGVDPAVPAIHQVPKIPGIEVPRTPANGDGTVSVLKASASVDRGI